MNLLATMPAITSANRGFWEAASRGVLALPHCRTCGSTWYPPAARCPACLSADVDVRAASGRATLWSWIVMHRRYFADFAPPYVVAFVRLEEGPMLMSTLAAGNDRALACDMPLVAVFERLSAEVSLLKFRAA